MYRMYVYMYVDIVSQLRQSYLNRKIVGLVLILVLHTWYTEDLCIYYTHLIIAIMIMKIRC